MDTLKKEIAVLMQCIDFKEIEKQLQVINKLIVTNYMFELSNGLRIYPIEVEAYFKDAKFNDEFVHGNELQKNNYGRIDPKKYDYSCTIRRTEERRQGAD